MRALIQFFPSCQCSPAVSTVPVRRSGRHSQGKRISARQVPWPASLWISKRPPAAGGVTHPEQAVVPGWTAWGSKPDYRHPGFRSPIPLPSSDKRKVTCLPGACPGDIGQPLGDGPDSRLGHYFGKWLSFSSINGSHATPSRWVKRSAFQRPAAFCQVTVRPAGAGHRNGLAWLPQGTTRLFHRLLQDAPGELRMVRRQRAQPRPPSCRINPPSLRKRVVQLRAMRWRSAQWSRSSTRRAYSRQLGGWSSRSCSAFGPCMALPPGGCKGSTYTITKNVIGHGTEPPVPLASGSPARYSLKGRPRNCHHRDDPPARLLLQQGRSFPDQTM